MENYWPDSKTCVTGVACPGEYQTTNEANKQSLSYVFENVCFINNVPNVNVLINVLPGILTQWSSYSSCSATCQLNVTIFPTQKRTRECQTATLGGNCGGASLEETKVCNKDVGSVQVCDKIYLLITIMEIHLHCVKLR